MKSQEKHIASGVLFLFSGILIVSLLIAGTSCFVAISTYPMLCAPLPNGGGCVQNSYQSSGLSYCGFYNGSQFILPVHIAVILALLIIALYIITKGNAREAILIVGIAAIGILLTVSVIEYKNSFIYNANPITFYNNQGCYTGYIQSSPNHCTAINPLTPTNGQFCPVGWEYKPSEYNINIPAGAGLQPYYPSTCVNTGIQTTTIGTSLIKNVDVISWNSLSPLNVTAIINLNQYYGYNGNIPAPPPSPPYSVTIDWGDGTIDHTQGQGVASGMHNYASAIQYTMKVTATNISGVQDTKTINVSSASNFAPTLNPICLEQGHSLCIGVTNYASCPSGYNDLFLSPIPTGVKVCWK